jgi:hypothetical protein
MFLEDITISRYIKKLSGAESGDVGEVNIFGSTTLVFDRVHRYSSLVLNPRILNKNLKNSYFCVCDIQDPYLQAGGSLDCASYARPTAPTAQQTLLSSKAEEVLL